MKVGDLVRIKKYCRDGGELAIVVEAPNIIKCVKIALMNTGKIYGSLVANLEVVCK